MLSELEKKVIAAIQGDMPICKRPYQALAERIGLSEETLLATLSDLRRRDLIRRFGATLRHQKSGYAANAMGAWQVDENRIEEVGRIMAGCRQISHCYRRNPTEAWPYNLYTMIHAESEDACWQIAREMAARAGVTHFTLLFSRRELKKTSMVYFRTGRRATGA
ncbi:MAG TPA: Lrp/AsnC family transcriptional regulator [Desulfosarcina sp.]|nr:Lrp/AsnC family transcriptional regulator [Desulfosarcina sp.]